MTLAPAEAERNIKSVMGRKGIALAALSGLLLTLAFPKWNLGWLAWIALVPWLGSLRQSRDYKEAFLYGFIAGFIFFFLSISWLRHVTIFGWLFVVTMLAFYWGVFGLVFFGCGGAPSWVPTMTLSAAWVALEFIRSEIPVWGSGWNLLGTSQASNLWLAQLASLGGVYSLSFLVFLGNLIMDKILREGIRKSLETSLPFFLLILAAHFFGWSRIQTYNPSPALRVSVLQGNIAQILKWETAYKEEILKVYLNLTELASYDSPELIVWPEAAYPGFFNREVLADRVKMLARQIQIPLLVGSPHQEDHAFYNSAYLLDRSGEIADRYDKIHLVPFGEYVPWHPIFGFLEPYAYTLGVSDFSPGKRFTVFNLGKRKPRFSVLICFEDVFPDLARKMVNAGADFLTVITNDAWFGYSSAPYQHLQASIFRAIENGVSVVRAANTGVSGFITSRGQVAERVRNQQGSDSFVIGGMAYPVAWNKEETLYRAGGWLFPYGCLAVLMIILGMRILSPRKIET